METVVSNKNFDLTEYIGKTEDNFEFNLFLDNEKCKNIKLEKGFYSSSLPFLEQQSSVVSSPMTSSLPLLSDIDISIPDFENAEGSASRRSKISGKFTSQPPSNVRKSNFFNFSFRLFDDLENPIKVEKCRFISYCDNNERNGIIYSVEMIKADKTITSQLIVVKVANSNTKELINFDGALTITN